MKDRIEDLEMTVYLMQEQIKTLQREILYMQQQIDDNCIWIKQEEKSKILA